jgi:hypothetical protein
MKTVTEIKVRNVKVGDIIQETTEETYYILGTGKSVTQTETKRWYVQGKCQSPSNMHRSWVQVCSVKADGSYKLRTNRDGMIAKMPRSSAEASTGCITYGARNWLKSKTVTLISRKEGN